MKFKLLIVLSFLLCNFSCRKNSSVDLLSVGWMVYEGDNAFLKDISNGIQEGDPDISALSGNGKLEANWDKSQVYFKMGDSAMHFLLPIQNESSVFVGHLSLTFSTVHKTTGVRFVKFDDDYVRGLDLENKVRNGDELLILLNNGVTIPKAFNTDSLKASRKAFLSFRNKIQKKREGKDGATAARGFLDCSSDVTCIFSWAGQHYGICAFSEAQMASAIWEEIKLVITLWAQNNDAYAQFSTTGIHIDHSANMTGMLENLIEQGFSNAANMYSSCNLNISVLDVSSTCDGDDGGGGGGGGDSNNNNIPDELEENPCSGELTQGQSDIILDAAMAENVVYTSPEYIKQNPDVSPVYEFYDMLSMTCSPTFKFFKGTYLPGSYVEFTAYYNARRFRESQDKPWKWSHIQWDKFAKSFNSMPGCLDTEMTIQSHNENMYSDSSKAACTLTFTYKIHIPMLLGMNLRTETHGPLTQVMLANSSEYDVPQ